MADTEGALAEAPPAEALPSGDAPQSGDEAVPPAADKEEAQILKEERRPSRRRENVSPFQESARFCEHNENPFHGIGSVFGQIPSARRFSKHDGMMSSRPVFETLCGAHSGFWECARWRKKISWFQESARFCEHDESPSHGIGSVCGEISSARRFSKHDCMGFRVTTRPQPVFFGLWRTSFLGSSDRPCRAVWAKSKKNPGITLHIER